MAERTDGAYSKSRISNYEQGLRRLSVEAAQVVGAALGNVMGAYLAMSPRGADGMLSPLSGRCPRGVRGIRSADRPQRRRWQPTASAERSSAAVGDLGVVIRCEGVVGQLTNVVNDALDGCGLTMHAMR